MFILCVCLPSHFFLSQIIFISINKQTTTKKTVLLANQQHNNNNELEIALQQRKTKVRCIDDNSVGTDHHHQWNKVCLIDFFGFINSNIAFLKKQRSV